MIEIDHNPHEKRPTNTIWWVGWTTAFVMFVSPAYALSGAEFLQADRNFASGFALGVTQYRISVLNVSDPSQQRIIKCITSSKINLDTLYEATTTRLKQHSHELSEPALSAVINTIAEICRQ